MHVVKLRVFRNRMMRFLWRMVPPLHAGVRAAVVHAHIEYRSAVFTHDYVFRLTEDHGPRLNCEIRRLTVLAVPAFVAHNGAISACSRRCRVEAEGSRRRVRNTLTIELPLVMQRCRANGVDSELHRHPGRHNAALWILRNSWLRKSVEANQPD